ncbi:MAG TPA: hypothetical protein VM537_14310 [Anaerolineae bacterium]|nr:hypothetical protein [Anaerolineae bacterium]
MSRFLVTSEVDFSSSLQHLPPEAPDAYPGEGKIVARPVLGGLINDYCRLAA